jgi:hypothetical protein
LQERSQFVVFKVYFQWAKLGLDDDPGVRLETAGCPTIWKMAREHDAKMTGGNPPVFPNFFS